MVPPARTDRAVPNADIVGVGLLAAVSGIAILVAMAGYWAIQPTRLANPGLSAYKPPAAVATVAASAAVAAPDGGWGADLPEIELAEREVADLANEQFGLRPTVLAGAAPADAATKRAVAAAKPKAKSNPKASNPKVAAQRVQKRQVASRPPPPRRIAQQRPPEPPSYQPTLAQRPFSLFWAN